MTALLRLLLLASLALAAATLAAPSAPPTEPPRFTFVSGDVTVASAPAAAFAPATLRGPVVDGAVIKTGAASRAELRFADGSVLRVGPGSELQLERARVDVTSRQLSAQTHLIAGSVWANVNPHKDGHRGFIVRTRDCVVGVRGTVFRVDVDADASVVKVSAGSVGVVDLPDRDVRAQRPDPRELQPPFKTLQERSFEWLLGQGMQLRVARGTGVNDTRPSETPADDGPLDWVRFNQERDGAKPHP